MAKIIVAYASATGATQGVAEKIAETLRSEGADVDLVAAKEITSFAAYDGAVLGSGIRVGKWLAAGKKMLAVGGLEGKRVALFCTCMAAVECKPEDMQPMEAYMETLAAGTGAVSTKVFAGAHDPKKLNLLMRLIMKMLKSPVGDYRDWEAIKGWAKEIAPQLLSA